MHAEYLIAWEDRTWTTEIEEVPDTIPREREAAVAWAEENLLTRDRYRGAVMFALYGFPDEYDDECLKWESASQRSKIDKSMDQLADEIGRIGREMKAE